MALDFAEGDTVEMEPLPFAMYKYGSYFGMTFTVTAVLETEEGVAYDLRNTHGSLAGVLGVHVHEPNNIVRARAECVSTRPLGGLLRQAHQFVVPLYQRKYCWTEAQWRGFWEDVLRFKPHSLERVILYQESWQMRPVLSNSARAPPRTLVIVDGQQRITTCLILLSCIRDAAVRMRVHSIAKSIDGLLLPNGSVSKGSTVEDCLRAAILVPTDDDHEAFAACLLGRESKHPSRITEANKFFANEIAQFLQAGGDLAALASFRDMVTVLHFELDDGDAVARFFEQLALRGQALAKLSHTRHSGIDLGEYDLLRNFLLGHFRGDGARMHVYRELWLEIERACNASGGDIQELATFMEGFLDLEGMCAVTESYKQCTSGLAIERRQTSLYGGYRALISRELQGIVVADECEAKVRQLLERMLACAKQGLDRRPVRVNTRPSQREQPFSGIAEEDEEESDP